MWHSPILLPALQQKPLGLLSRLLQLADSLGREPEEAPQVPARQQEPRSVRSGGLRFVWAGLIAQVPAQQQEPEQVDEPRWRCAEPYCRRDLTNLTYFAVEPEEAGPDLVVDLAASKHSVLRTLAF